MNYAQAFWLLIAVIALVMTFSSRSADAHEPAPNWTPHENPR